MSWTPLFVLCTSHICNSYGQGTRAELFEEKIAEASQLFSGLEGVKGYFRNSTNPLAKQILQTFENECFDLDEPELPPDRTRKPFIVLEGNHKISREVVGVRLASTLDGRYLVHPATCLIKFLDIIPKGTLIRRAYYVLSLYATSYNVKVHLSMGRAVVLNGYWLDQLSFSLVQSLTNVDLPPATSDLFKCPKGLLQPDLLFYLNFPDDLFLKQHTTRSPKSWKRRVVALYDGLQTRYPIVMHDLKCVFRITADDVYRQIFDRLSKKRDVILRKHRLEDDTAVY